MFRYVCLAALVGQLAVAKSALRRRTAPHSVQASSLAQVKESSTGDDVTDHDAAESSYLVYTAAGNNHNVKMWLSCGVANFSMFVSFYGSDEEKATELEERVMYFQRVKGWKFNLLSDAMRDYSYIFDAASHVLVSDDDLTFTAGKLNLLFAIHNHYNLTLSHPSMLDKLSWGSNAHRENSILRYGSFVEVTAPVFRIDALRRFMHSYEPVLKGWGLDILYYSVLMPQDHEYAVIDAVKVVNPPQREVHGSSGHKSEREILKVGSNEVRKHLWLQYQQNHSNQIHNEYIDQRLHNWYHEGYGDSISILEVPEFGPFRMCFDEEQRLHCSRETEGVRFFFSAHRPFYALMTCQTVSQFLTRILARALFARAWP